MRVFFLCLGFSLTIFVSAQNGTTFASAKSTKKATFILYYDGLSGLIDRNSSGQTEGFLVDVMNAFRAHLKTKYGISVATNYKKQKAFQSMMTSVKNSSGGVFALSNISITTARKASYQFSPAYLKNIVVLVTNNQVATLSKLENIKSEFAGKTAYTVASTTYSARLKEIKSKHFQTLKIVELPSTDAVLAKVRSDKNAFAVVDLIYYLGNYKKSGSLKRHATGDNDQGDRLAIAMSKKNDWATEFNTFYKAYSRTSAYKASVGKHLGSSSLRMTITY